MKMMDDPAGLESISTNTQDAAESIALLMPSSEYGLTKFLDPLHIPRVITAPADKSQKSIKITAFPVSVKLHSQLSPTRMWTYNGSFPGPTIEVRSGHSMHAIWENAITGSFPVSAVDVLPENGTPGPGRDGAKLNADVAALPPWTVVHLHGARTNAFNDGWTENASLPGSLQRSDYLNEQRACTLWYHDHAMGITSLNMMAGLMGMYLIRDDEEDALHLPCGEREVPLIICDRNVDTDAQGDLTSELLYKTFLTPGKMGNIRVPFLGPFTLVNGVIWPHLNVDACWYRFRILNASNQRGYRLVLRDAHGTPIAGALHQIGTDSGLLPQAVALDELTLLPAERADILIDFSAFRGESLVLGNTYNPVELGLPPDTPTTPNPEVMQFRVRAANIDDDFVLPGTIAKSFVRLSHDSLPDHHAHRWIVLTLLNGGHPEMWEMDEIEHPPAVLPVDGVVQVQLNNGTVKTLRRASRSFRDAANFYVEYDGWEIWNILNLSPVIHPIHLHLVEFQTIGLGRQRFNIQSFNNDVGGTSTPVIYMEPGKLDASDRGWKDTIRVGLPDSGELVTIAARFEGGTGRYMYHCHILEHEDDGMMSTFIVTPKEVMAVDPMHGPMHGGGHSHGF
jgi:FtsP/CotA-like multicopper oxidase with cupredoxin domain